MLFRRLGLVGLAIIGGLSTAACNDGYGYGGVSGGYGFAHADPYYSGYGPGYASYGWYGDYYYPGTGYYVYDRYRRPFPWNDGQRRYWEGRRGNGQVRANWADFRRDVRRDRQAYRNDLRENVQGYRNGTATPDQFRQDRRDARREYRGDVGRETRQLHPDNRAVRGFDARPRSERGLDSGPRPDTGSRLTGDRGQARGNGSRGGSGRPARPN